MSELFGAGMSKPRFYVEDVQKKYMGYKYCITMILDDEPAYKALIPFEFGEDERSAKIWIEKLADAFCGLDLAVR